MSDDVRALLDMARESVSAARLLLDQGYHRFAASRAYYAMFYVAEALLASRGESFSRHAGVIAAFGRKFAKTGEMDSKYHRWFIDAQRLRTTSDYAIGWELSPEQAEETISRADEFIRAAGSLLTH